MAAADEAIARIAAQHIGPVPRSLALTAGVSVSVIEHRLAHGDLSETQRLLAAGRAPS
jgi:hypothetical protein